MQMSMSHIISSSLFIESLDLNTFKNTYTEGCEKQKTLTGWHMCKYVYFHHYFHWKTYFFVFKVIVYMLECVCVMVCECLCVWVPAKFAELRLDPLIILCVGVDQGDEKDILSPHIQKVSTHLLNCILVLQMFPLFYKNFYSPFWNQNHLQNIPNLLLNITFQTSQASM